MKLNPSFTGIPPTLTNHFPGGAWRLLSRSAAGLAPLLAAALLTGISHAQQQDPLVIKDGNATFSGNVGISTDAPPSAKLELVATFPESYLLKLRNAFPTWGDPGHFNQYRFIITDSATTGQPYPDTFKQFQVGAGGVAIGGNHDNPLLPPSYLSPDALYVMGNVGVSAGNLTVNGNVGIGTTSPVGKLNVQADGKGDWAGDDGIGQVIISGATAPENCLGLMIDTGKQVGKIQAELRGFRALPLALNPMGGNVGIGTDNPTKAKLEIDGNVQSNNGESIYFTRQAARALDYDPDGKINTNVSIYSSDVTSVCASPTILTRTRSPKAARRRRSSSRSKSSRSTRRPSPAEWMSYRTFTSRLRSPRAGSPCRPLSGRMSACG